MTLFDRIKKVAKSRGYSIAEVERKAGISTNYMYQWKKRKPNPETLKKVADVLGVSMEYLLGNSKEEDEPGKIDLKDEMLKKTLMSYGGRPIPDEELEMIRRILEGGN